ncbi:MAG: cytochrome c oxidase subunit II [Verrucomicrobia bacterium]|nr:MAG: cytochrome c oxidase subunit II [Verrucomicrobiota bacterium]PYK67866.1 MAG: cytochrome c oxidase subunit II [Verrucomicrobiota bacterium]
MDKFRLFPPEASTSAQQIDWIYFALVALTFLICIIVFVPIISFAIKYRRGSKADRSNPRVESVLIESGWTIVPLLIFIGLFGWGAVVYFHVENPPRDALQVIVVGKQWMWRLQHAEGKQEINELHVPVARAVELTMTSQDVIHSFFVPAFRLHQDVVPGKYTREWFRATRTGEYHIFCSQYCGTQHSAMIGRVVVMEPVDYARWLNTGQPMESIALAGERLFRERGCSGCHSVNSKFHAPLLEGTYRKPVPLETGEMVTVDERYVRDSILLPGKEIAKGYQNIMPSFAGTLSEEEIMQLIAYIKSIGNQTPSNESAPNEQR